MKIKTYVELELEVDVDYTPARSMPASQDHDSPRYCDSGDDEVVEITDAHFTFYKGTLIKRVSVPEDVMKHVIDKIIDDVTDQCRDAVERKGADHLDAVKQTIRAMHDIPRLAGYK